LTEIKADRGDSGGLDAEAKAELVEMEKEGKYDDLTTFRLKKPEKLRTVMVLLGKGFVIRDVCRIARVSASTVCQVLRDPELGPSIAKAKAHVTGLTKAALRVGLENKLAEWTAPNAKPPAVFDLQLLHQMSTLDDGGATVRVEHFGSSTLQKAEEDLYRMVDGATRTVEATKICNGEQWTESVHGTVGMGLDSQKVHALPALTEQPAVPDEVGESERSAPIT
jgi:hypothetical protein